MCKKKPINKEVRGHTFEENAGYFWMGGRFANTKRSSIKIIPANN